MSRIRDTFFELKHSGRGGFIPFIIAGDPDLVTTELLLVELAAAGADIIELGVPFSDPVADGEVIQRASERALRKGVTLSDALKCVLNVKEQIDVPIVLFSYLNPLLKFGRDRLAEEVQRAGIDAVSGSNAGRSRCRHRDEGVRHVRQRPASVPPSQRPIAGDRHSDERGSCHRGARTLRRGDRGR